MSFGSRRPTQQLNIHCSKCGGVTVRFESFVADGVVFEMVGNKLSEMMAFISASPEVVLCSECTAKAEAEAEERRLRLRDKVRRQMEPKPSAPAILEQPASYLQSNGQRKESKLLRVRSKKEVDNDRLTPRRAASTRERVTSER